jgi:cobalt-zinc-cadmium efflux system membrane fusion protein
VDSAAKAGIVSRQPERSMNSPGLQVLCEAQYNGNRIARVTPLADGIVQRVWHDVGDQVLAGVVLAELHSAEAALAKSTYLSTLVALEIKKETRTREEKLQQGSISAKKDYLKAEGEFRMARLAANNARHKLLNLGLKAETIAKIERTEDASAILKIYAPFDGTLIERTAVTGQSVDSGEALFILADLSTRWLILSLPSDRLTQVRVGLPVEARFDELPGEAILGTLVWIDTAVDKRTRLVRARAMVSNGVDRVKAGMFGQAKIITQAERQGLLVPRDAVQNYEQRSYVFVRKDRDLFALRHVTLGDASKNEVEVLGGLHLDEAVVTSGFLVMSEFLKSRLGAGCVDD